MKPMADEFVGAAQFGEFVKRMEQHYEGIMERFADAEKARERNLVHVDQRFDNLEKRMDFQNRMTLTMWITIGSGILIGLVKYLFFPG